MSDETPDWAPASDSPATATIASDIPDWAPEAQSQSDIPDWAPKESENQPATPETDKAIDIAKGVGRAAWGLVPKSFTQAYSMLAGVPEHTVIEEAKRLYQVATGTPITEAFPEAKRYAGLFQKPAGEQAELISERVLPALIAGVPLLRGREGVPLRTEPLAPEAPPTVTGGPPTTATDVSAAMQGPGWERRFTMQEPPPEARPELAAAPTIEETLARTAPPIVSPETGFAHYPTEELTTEPRPIRTETAAVEGGTYASTITSPESVPEPQVRARLGEEAPLQQPRETTGAQEQPVSTGEPVATAPPEAAHGAGLGAQYTVENSALVPGKGRRSGLTIYDGPVDNPSGVIEAHQLPGGELEAYHMVVDPKLRGTGRGVGLWQKLVDSAGDSPVVTDDSVSQSAAHALEGLGRRGYTIEKNPSAKLVDVGLDEKQWMTPDKSPVFRITGKPTKPAPQPITAELPTGETGISQARTEAELGTGSVEPGAGAELGSGLAFGRDFINKGGDPRLPIRRATASGIVGKNDVGVVHAELERLRAERNAAARVLEANPDNPLAKQAFDQADTAQRAWRKELQPVLTKASDTLREAHAQSMSDADPGTYQGLADLMDEHFKGQRDITDKMRTSMAKAAKGVRDTRDIANGEMKKVEDVLTKKSKTKQVMTPEQLDADLKAELENQFKDCVIGG